MLYCINHNVIELTVNVKQQLVQYKVPISSCSDSVSAPTELHVGILWQVLVELEKIWTEALAV
jgi:hypothetical protein